MQSNSGAKKLRSVLRSFSFRMGISFRSDFGHLSEFSQASLESVLVGLQMSRAVIMQQYFSEERFFEKMPKQSEKKRW